MLPRSQVKRRTPLYWDQISEKQLFGPEIIDDAEQMVQAVRENLRIAQSRQKSYADGKRRDLTFSVGDYVYLKVSPMRGIRRFNVKGKLAPRYVGPFKVLERKGEVAYRLELPPSDEGGASRGYPGGLGFVLSSNMINSD